MSNDPWFHKVYVREHFVSLSTSMISDLFNLSPCDLPTEAKNEDGFEMDKIVTTFILQKSICTYSSSVPTMCILLLIFQLWVIRC